MKTVILLLSLMLVSTTGYAGNVYETYLAKIVHLLQNIDTNTKELVMSRKGDLEDKVVRLMVQIQKQNKEIEKLKKLIKEL